MLEKELPPGAFVGTEGLVQALDRLFPEGMPDRVGDLLSIFQIETREGKQALAESLVAFRNATQDMPSGMQVKFFVKNYQAISPHLYHHSPNLKRLVVKDGQIRLSAFSGERGWYVSPDRFDTAQEAFKAFELPSLDNARYRIKLSTEEVTDALKIPYGKVNESPHFEPLTRDYPKSGGSGGAKQLLLENKEAEVLEVFDTVERRALSKEEIIQLINR